MPRNVSHRMDAVYKEQARFFKFLKKNTKPILVKFSGKV